MHLIKTTNAEVDINEVLDTGRFDFEQAVTLRGWIKELTEGGHAEHTPETEEYGIGSFVYSRRLPFRETFQRLVRANANNIVRAKVSSGWHNIIKCMSTITSGSSCNISPVTYG